MDNYERIEEIIAGGGENIEALKEAREKLGECFKDLHKACDAAALAYKKSYDDDVHKAAELLAQAEKEAAAIQIKIGQINAAMPKLLVAGDDKKIAEIENATNALEDQLRDKEKRIKLLQNYKPTGDEDLFKAATAAKEKLEEAYKFARERWTQLVENIREKKHQLDLMDHYIGNSSQLGSFSLDAVSREDLRAMHDGGAYLGDVINKDDKIRQEHADRAKAFKEQREHLKEMGIDLDK